MNHINKLILATVIVLAGCKSVIDPNYAAYLNAQQTNATIRAAELEILNKAVQHNSPEVAVPAVMAVALRGSVGAGSSVQPPATRPDNILGWAQMLLNTGLSAFGIHVNKQIQLGGQQTQLGLEDIRSRTTAGIVNSLAGVGGGNTTNSFTFGDGSSGIVGDNNNANVQRDIIDNSLHDNPIDNSNQYNPSTNYNCSASSVCP